MTLTDRLHERATYLLIAATVLVLDQTTKLEPAAGAKPELLFLDSVHHAMV